MRSRRMASLDQPVDQAEPRLDRRAVGQRRGDVLAQQAAAGGGLAAVDLAEQAAGDAARRRAGELEAVAAGGVDRHVRDARDPARRVEQDAGAALGRVEIGEQAARRGELGARRRAEPVERREAEARLERALAAEAVEPAFAGAWSSRPGTGSSAIISAGWSRASSAASSPGAQAISSNRPVEMSAAAIAHVVAGAPDRREPVGRRRIRASASSVSVPGVTRRTMARSTSALDPRALRASAGLSICSAMATRWPPLISRAR